VVKPTLRKNGHKSTPRSETFISSSQFILSPRGHQSKVIWTALQNPSPTQNQIRNTSQILPNSSKLFQGRPNKLPNNLPSTLPNNLQTLPALANSVCTLASSSKLFRPVFDSVKSFLSREQNRIVSNQSSRSFKLRKELR